MQQSSIAFNVPSEVTPPLADRRVGDLRREESQVDAIPIEDHHVIRRIDERRLGKAHHKLSGIENRAEVERNVRRSIPSDRGLVRFDEVGARSFRDASCRS